MLKGKGYMVEIFISANIVNGKVGEALLIGEKLPNLVNRIIFLNFKCLCVFILEKFQDRLLKAVQFLKLFRE